MRFSIIYRRFIVLAVFAAIIGKVSTYKFINLSLNAKNINKVLTTSVSAKHH